jgi:hypothetical protein
MPRTLYLTPLVALGLAYAAPVDASETTCTELTLGGTLHDAAQRAEVAFGATRVEEFQQAIQLIDGLIPCLMEPVDPGLAAFVHRMQGLGAFIGRDQDRARQAFAAARGLQPDYSWPEDLIPWGHPLLGLYQSFPLEGAAFEAVPPPAAGWVYLDGRPSEPRPREWPTIIQVSDAEGAIQLSTYLWPGDPLPDYADDTPVASVPPKPVPTSSVPEQPALANTVAATSTTVRTGPRAGLLASAGGAAVASGVLWALADRSGDQYWDPATPQSDLDRARRRTNGLVLASAGTGALALGTGVVAFLELQW